MKILQFFSLIPYKKYIAGFLVSVIVISQTIHVDFFDSAIAGPENYRDIVSIIVDKDTYSVERNRILQYANDISGYLGGVRTSILVVEKNTPVATIAQKNEKLYYEWDGEKWTSVLVGSVFIGNIPIPTVTKDGMIFPSLYPYVDFVDKAFVYDEKNSGYTYNTTDLVSESVEIWHGVINPAVGRNWGGATDIAKIGQFLDKTHAFYTKSGKFAPSTIPPKVFYYDWQSESKSIDSRGLFQYSLSMKNAENIAYNRFTKYLLRDISTALKSFDKQKEDPEISSLYATLGIPQGSDTLSEEQIKKLPDTQSKDVILWFLKNFKWIFNEKTLWEELLAVHNAGRYNSGSKVGADLLPISISLMDDIARATLKTSNQALVASIDRSLESGIASKIVLFDKNIPTFSGGVFGQADGMVQHKREYQNYYFWVPSQTISNPSQCTIARGFAWEVSQFGRSVLVEANAAFDISSTQSHIGILKQDTDQLIWLHRNATYSCFNPTTSAAKLNAYWWDNSILKLTSNLAQWASADSFLFDPSPATSFNGFSLPIFSLGWMKESSRIANPSIANCIEPGYQYTLLQPFLTTYRDDDFFRSRTYTVAWPNEWNIGGVYNGGSSPRFTCNTQHQVGSAISIATSITEYSSRTCFVGNLYLNGSLLRTATNSCKEMVGFGDDMYEVDKTFYEDRYYHTIPSVWSHVSPTDEEIAASKINGVTPSLAINQIRYVEFLTPKWNVARINYPNFFELEWNDIASVRNWIKTQSTQQWQQIISTENATGLSAERSIVNQSIPPGAIPATPIDWNIYVSDPMIEKMIQAKNWLHPDISTKYRKAIESILSYSHVNTAVTPFVATAPKIPALSDEYEIAYLGLPSSFGADFSNGSSSNNSQAGYDTRIREIEWANISDEAQSDTDPASNPATECGPPDWVPLLQWPAAIMCWIKAQFPPRILAGSCGPSSIGITSPNVTESQSPSISISSNSIALTAFFAGSRVIPHLPRTSLQLRDTIAIDLDLQKNNTLLNALPDTTAHLEIVSLNAGGANIASSKFADYISIAPEQSLVWEKWAKFLIESLGKEAIVRLRSYYIIPLPDNSELRINSEEFQVRITPEYYSISVDQVGSDTWDIDITSSEKVILNIKKILKNSTSIVTKESVTLEIFDDISGDIVYTGSAFVPWTELPINITKKIGVYRIIIRDSAGISGEINFVVHSGILSQIRIVPISSALIKWASTIAMVRLLDRLGNPISSNIHTLALDVTGGYIIDPSGTKKTNINMDIIESQIPILIGADSPGILSMKATVDDTIKGSKDITIFDTARIVLKRDSAPKVWGQPTPVHIEIQDPAGKPIGWLSSVASWKLPDGAGKFSKETITITDGISENFEYLPGTISWNHSLSIDVPGVWSLSDIIFSLLPWEPMYISHIKNDNSIVFSLRDRYNNISSFSSFVWTIIHNNTASRPIVFSQWEYTIPLQWWEYNLTVPGIKNNSISYIEKDATGKDIVQSIYGIDIYTAYISGNQETIDFAPDYNARYTVLAGGSFLREGEDILYNTTPGQSQSLAVSTILDNPYKEDILATMLPWGAYRINNEWYDTVLKSNISFLNRSPLLTISDVVTHKQVVRVLYRMENAAMETCQVSKATRCDTPRTQPTIRLIAPEGTDLTMSSAGWILTLNSSNENILSINKNGSITAISRVSFASKDTSTLGLEIGVMLDNREVAKLLYIMDPTLSVEKNSNIDAVSQKNTPIILSSWFSITKSYGNPLYPTAFGYKIFSLTNSQELDETKNGPDHSDSIGALSEIPGVGWQWNNTMLLAYAGWDTVGETTRFFHTYTMVNLGDPVTHIDHNRPGTEIDGIDRTIGSIIARGTRSGIADVFHRDMNADGITDLNVLYQDGYMELFLNQGGKFRSRGMITYNKDLDSKKMAFGDFTHDGYGDIIGLNKNGNLILIDNTTRKFSRVNISLGGWPQVLGHISQFRIYDMDADSRDDIVYITAGGELGILYGTQIPWDFVQKILDSTLGITLSGKPTSIWGSIRASNTPQSIPSLWVSPTTSTGTDDTMLKWEVFYEYSHPTPVESATVTPETLEWVYADIANWATGNKIDIFVRSQYATAYGLAIEKIYTNVTHPVLYPDDMIQARISIKNTTNTTIKNIEYLDTLPKVFSSEKTQKYTIKIGNTMVNKTFEPLSSSDYDMYFVGWDLAPGETMEILYDLVALPASYGEMIVGNLEKGTTWADAYGDVGFKTSTTCGASMLLWTSGPASRDYTRGTHEFWDTDLPDWLADRLVDADKNGTPDSIENMSLADREKAYKDISIANTPASQSIMKAIQNGTQFNIWFDEAATTSIIDATQNLLDGLSCGFGGGSCLNSPLNWAPLAPGSSPTLFWIPILPNLMTPSGGLPIFSGLTGLQMACGPVPCCIPTVYPMSPLGFVPGPACWLPSAWWMLWTWAPTNFIRIYVTPTLTLGMGTAICLGGPAASMWQIPPPALSPLIQWWNCIVMAKAMPVCKSDGSEADGNVTEISGLGGVGGDTWNATSCHPEVNVMTESEDLTLTTDIVNYLKNPDTKRLNDMYTRIARRGPRLPSWPLLNINWGWDGLGALDINIDSNTKISDIGSVIKLKNKRIAAFPDFLMDWLTRQTDEITTSLFTPPNLTIVKPASFGQNAQVDKSYENFSKDLGRVYSSANFDNIKKSMGTAFDKKNTTTKWVPDSLQWTISGTKWTLNSIKSAYTLIGKLPFITIQQSNIPLNIPWINKNELDRYTRSLEGYKKEIDNAQKNLCINDPSPACLAKKASLKSSPFVGSILENLKRIEDYKRFPMKIQKYITWKERYIAQVLCNINTIQYITGWWLRDNGIRFRKWAELYVLIRAIAEGWQPLLDIFSDTSKSCGVCRNERNNLQYWKFKLLSMLIPSIPVIKFPKWPDIILDLSDIRFGISISMPNFDPRISPIRLPNLPSLSIWDASASLGLPALLLLPKIPSLPDLPDLPSLPKVKLPDLPPPPKLPKIAGSITAFLKIMKLISKMYCFYQKTFLVPEWQAGDVIANRTERQGTLPFDFINLSLPQFSLPALKEIRVGSHVNYSLRSEFISEFARTAVKPVNSFQTDIQLGMPKKIGEDVSIQSVRVDANPKLPYNIEEKMHPATTMITKLVETLEANKDVFLDVDEFSKYMMSEFSGPEFANNRTTLQKELRSAQIMADSVQKELLVYNEKRFQVLKDYVSSEGDNIAHLQNIADLLNKDISSVPRELIADIDVTSSRSARLLAEFNTLQNTSTDTDTQTIMTQDSGLRNTKIALDSKLSRMIAANSSSSSSSSSAIAEWYSPHYQGIYIRTPSGIQTQLFDYISPLQDDTRVDTLDIDLDWDMDYIFILDGVLYVKYSWKNSPNKIYDTTVKISEITQNEFSPYIPDYFHENLSAPKNLNFSFVSSSKDETEWRAEFYDRYIEWDHVDIWDHDPKISPKTTIDMFLRVPSLPIEGSPMSITKTTRSLKSVNDRWSFVIEWRSIDVYTGALSISLSPGRVLYTGRDSVTISYTSQTDPTPKNITLDPYTGYEFSDITEITTTGGRFYLIGQEDGSIYTYSNDFIWLPILPGMRIYASDAGSVLRNHTSENNIVLGWGASYSTYDLGDRSQRYEISVPYINGYYYARMANLTAKKSDRAGVILFAPQASSDDGAPIVDLPTRIRLPIYATKSYKISDILTDLSQATITIDNDLTLDSDKNNISDDDFATSGTGFSISSQTLTFGKFTTPGKYTMLIQAVDDMGNTSAVPLKIEAYAVIPQIQSVTKQGNLTGSIAEPVSDTPVHFFRVRSGEVPALVNPASTLTSPTGWFATGSFFSNSETINLKLDTTAGSITSHGAITLPPGYSVWVSPASSAAPMELLVNSWGSILYRHSLSLPDNTMFIDSTKATNTANTGVFITPLAGITLFTPAATSDPSIPGGTYITDISRRPIIAIARDGNIYIVDPTVSLKYKVQGGYMAIEIVRGATLLATVEYRIDFFYTMK
jgi:hypothetical protein